LQGVWGCRVCGAISPDALGLLAIVAGSGTLGDECLKQPWQTPTCAKSIAIRHLPHRYPPFAAKLIAICRIQNRHLPTAQTQL
jgi:hypothetical protein